VFEQSEELLEADPKYTVRRMLGRLDQALTVDAMSPVLERRCNVPTLAARMGARAACPASQSR